MGYVCQEDLIVWLLLMLMRDWVKNINGKIYALHFNHNLRYESNLEAKILEKTIKNWMLIFLKLTGTMEISTLESWNVQGLQDMKI